MRGDPADVRRQFIIHWVKRGLVVFQAVAVSASFQISPHIVDFARIRLIPASRRDPLEDERIPLDSNALALANFSIRWVDRYV